MKPPRKNSTSALTLIEVLIVIAVMAILAAVLLADMGPISAKAQGIACMNNLKQVQLSFRLWAGDNDDKYPTQISITNGGAMEPAATGNLVPVFQVMSNELNTPKILGCPADTNWSWATNFAEDFRGNSLGYVVNLDATPSGPASLLTGDRNFTSRSPIDHGILQVTTNQAIGWTTDIHPRPPTILFGTVKLRKRPRGNIALTDGNVQRVDNFDLTQALQNGGSHTNRLVIP